ncbi:MAG: hypothetical protein KJO91_10015 [Gammaproteobacteria bacterium]|nr:hypothetical protein [Gammaproteobacteria bacterium]
MRDISSRGLAEANYLSRIQLSTHNPAANKYIIGNIAAGALLYKLDIGKLLSEFLNQVNDMKKIYKPGKLFRIPDGTLLSPFINPKDSMSDLPFDLIDGFSIAQGVVEADKRSKIHVHPHVDQVIYVLSGNISLKMKGAVDKEPYILTLSVNQSAISVGGDFFQLVNESDKDCHVLYIVSPAYLFELRGEEVIYDDSIILNQSWDELKALDWSPSELADDNNSKAARKASFERLKKLKTTN